MYQPVRLAALERRYLDNRDESLSGQAAHYGKGPFRWVALSGDPEDIYRTDEAILELFPEDAGLRRWITMARQKIHFQGLPARICWLGYGQRDNALLNTASGATWVSVHHGGGVGIGYSLHAGQVIVADVPSAAAEPIARVLTNDPGSGVMRQGKRA